MEDNDTYKEKEKWAINTNAPERLKESEASEQEEHKWQDAD